MHNNVAKYLTEFVGRPNHGVRLHFLQNPPQTDGGPVYTCAFLSLLLGESLLRGGEFPDSDDVWPGRLPTVQQQRDTMHRLIPALKVIWLSRLQNRLSHQDLLSAPSHDHVEREPGAARAAHEPGAARAAAPEPVDALEAASEPVEMTAGDRDLSATTITAPSTLAQRRRSKRPSCNGEQEFSGSLLLDQVYQPSKRVRADEDTVPMRVSSSCRRTSSRSSRD